MLDVAKLYLVNHLVDSFADLIFRDAFERGVKLKMLARR